MGCIGPWGVSVVPAFPQREGALVSSFCLLLSFLVWVAQRPSRHPVQGPSQYPVTLILGRALPSLQILISSLSHSPASFLLCSCSPGHLATHTLFCPQWLPFLDPAASSVMWFLSSTADMSCLSCTLCCAPLPVRAQLLPHSWTQN